MGILPWGLVDQDRSYVWPNEYTQGISIVNNLIQAYAMGLNNVHYIDCGHALFPTGQVILYHNTCMYMYVCCHCKHMM